MSVVPIPMNEAAALALAGAAALFVAHFVAQFVTRAGVLPDRPNGRSSHQAVTPRSGGVAIFAGWAAGMAVFAALTASPAILELTTRLILLSGVVLLVGLADDRYAPRAIFKLGGQVLAAAAFVAVFGALEVAPVPFAGDTPLGLFAVPLTILWIVAFMNAFNFMDGVNGIAGACGAFVLLALCLVAAFCGAVFWGVAAGICGIAVCAFLPINFPKGRLFMGDNGSQTIGFLIAALAIGAARSSGGGASALFVPTAMAPFLFDVAFTLGHRLIRKQNILAAHREHLYQLLLRTGASHAEVTATYLALVALSVAAAVFMLRMPPGEQWYAPAALSLLMTAPAVVLYLRAKRLGLLAPPVLAPVRTEPQARGVESVRVHAAE